MSPETYARWLEFMAERQRFRAEQRDWVKNNILKYLRRGGR